MPEGFQVFSKVVWEFRVDYGEGSFEFTGSLRGTTRVPEGFSYGFRVHGLTKVLTRRFCLPVLYFKGGSVFRLS